MRQKPIRRRERASAAYRHCRLELRIGSCLRDWPLLILLLLSCRSSRSLLLIRRRDGGRSTRCKSTAPPQSRRLQQSCCKCSDRNTRCPKQIEQESANKSAHDPERDVQPEALSLLLDKFASNEASNQTQYDPAKDAHDRSP